MVQNYLTQFYRCTYTQKMFHLGWITKHEMGTKFECKPPDKNLASKKGAYVLVFRSFFFSTFSRRQFLRSFRNKMVKVVLTNFSYPRQMEVLFPSSKSRLYQKLPHYYSLLKIRKQLLPLCVVVKLTMDVKQNMNCKKNKGVWALIGSINHQ